MSFESPQFEDKDSKISFPADRFYCVMLVHIYHGILQISTAISLPSRGYYGFFMISVMKPQIAFLTIELSAKYVFNRR